LPRLTQCLSRGVASDPMTQWRPNGHLFSLSTHRHAQAPDPAFQTACWSGDWIFLVMQRPVPGHRLTSLFWNSVALSHPREGRDGASGVGGPTGLKGLPCSGGALHCYMPEILCATRFGSKVSLWAKPPPLPCALEATATLHGGNPSRLHLGQESF